MDFVGYFKTNSILPPETFRQRLEAYCQSNGHRLLACIDEPTLSFGFKTVFGRLKSGSVGLICLDWSDLLHGDLFQQCMLITSFIGPQRQRLIIANENIDNATDEGLAALVEVWTKLDESFRLKYESGKS